MLIYYLDELCKGILLLMAAVMVCAAYAYYVNSRRAAGDPNKKNYHPLAIVLAPITLPIFLILSISFLLLRIVTYGVFMVVLTSALIFIRKPFILTAIQKIAAAIGDRLMAAHTMLIRLLLKPWADEPNVPPSQTIYSGSFLKYKL
jgi:hypothetical protein